MNEIQKIPSAQSLLINALQPHERALLYIALLSYKMQCVHQGQEDSFNENPVSAMSDYFASYCRWAGVETDNILDHLFEECFPEDLNPFRFHQKYLKELL